MRLSHIIEAVYCRPWLITPTGHAAIRRLIESKLAGTISYEVMDMGGGTADRPACYSTNGSVARIDVCGVIGKNLSFIEKSCGACGVEDVGESIDLALADSRIQQVLMVFDSPGGTVSGLPELAAKLQDANKEKPITAFVDGTCASAAYWLAASASQILATMTSDAGSIGVYQAYLDKSVAMEKAGYSIDVIKAGKFKAEGLPGTSLSEEFKAMLQDEVNTIYGWFTEHVSMNRPGVKDSTMQGQTFMGQAAQKAGLVDGIVSDLAQAVQCMGTP